MSGARRSRAVALGCKLGASGEPPSLTNDFGTACYGTGAESSFAGVAVGFYWSGTSDETSPLDAWYASLTSAHINFSTDKLFTRRVWPVRG